jgi:hypothetical protein
MPRPGGDLLGRAQLDQLAQVHHPDPVAHVRDHGQVVRDEQVRETKVRLQVAQ